MACEQQSLIASSPVARRVELVVPGKPVAKGRPRFSRQGGQVRTHTPEKTERYENLVKVAANAVMRGAAPFDGPVRFVVHIGVPIPSSWSMKRQAAAAAGLIGATKKPDWSNVVKAIEDGLNGIVYVDDAQIIDGWVSKRYTRTPGVRVEVIELNLQKA